MVVLTGTDLFAPGGLRHEWKTRGGPKRKLTRAAYVHMSNLVTLADLTQQVYLNLPNYGAWFSERMKKRHRHRNNTSSAAVPSGADTVKK